MPDRALNTATVVVHGLWMPGPDTWLLRRRLDTHGFGPRLYRYHSVRTGLDDNTEALATHLATIPADTLHLVGHSLGGVVIVAMLQRFGLDRPGRVVCLGSPLKGTVAGRKFSRWPGVRHALGQSITELNAAGGLARWDDARELGIVAGCVSMGLSSVFTHLPRPNDGVVTVDETHLEGARDHIVVETSHVGLLWSREAWRAVYSFLLHGRFVS